MTSKRIRNIAMALALVDSAWRLMDETATEARNDYEGQPMEFQSSEAGEDEERLICDIVETVEKLKDIQAALEDIHELVREA